MSCILFKQRLFLTTGKFASDLPDITTSNAYRLDSMYCGSFIDSRLMEYCVTIDAQERNIHKFESLSTLIYLSVLMQTHRHLVQVTKARENHKVEVEKIRHGGKFNSFSKITDTKNALKNRLK